MRADIRWARQSALRVLCDFVSVSKEASLSLMNIQVPPPRASEPAPARLLYPSSKVGKALIYSLEEPVEPQRRGIFLDAIGQQGAEAGWWIVGAAVLSMALLNLVIGWLSDNNLNWSWYWSFEVYGLAAQLLILWGAWYTHRDAARRPDGLKNLSQISVRSLRRAALVGDDSLVPPITNQGDASEVPEPSTATTAFTVLPPEWRLLRQMRIAVGVCLGLCIVFSVILLIASIRDTSWYWVFLGFVPPFFNFSLWQFISLVRGSRSFRVEVRADGVYWKKYSIPWSEVHGWFVLSLELEYARWTHPSAVYVLLGERTSLTWITYPPESDAQDPGKQLAALVQTHLGMPLRDLTPGAICISEDIGSRLFMNVSGLLATNSRNAWWGSYLPRLPAALVTFTLSALILLAGILTPYGQQWYFGRQLTQMEMTKSALRDPLTASTLHWIPGAGYYNAKYFAFTPDGYVVSGDSCCDLSSLIPQPVSNGLVEVTLRQQPKDGLSDAGIIFRANSSSHTAFVFTLELARYWQLSRYTIGGDGGLSYEHYLSSGVPSQWTKPPNRQNYDTTNRLAVLMQGSSLTFFINGQFVGRYWSSDLPPSGQIGVYANSYEGTVTFSDLLIAPA
jgi:hypothetical protein